MTLSRRTFLAAGLSLAAAPAIVRAESIMRVAPVRPPRGFFFHIDTRAVYTERHEGDAWLRPDGSLYVRAPGGEWTLTDSILTRGASPVGSVVEVSATGRLRIDGDTRWPAPESFGRMRTLRGVTPPPKRIIRPG